MRKLLYIICLSTLASCHLATNSTPSDADSVPQSVFAPLETDTVMPSISSWSRASSFRSTAS